MDLYCVTFPFLYKRISFAFSFLPASRMDDGRLLDYLMHHDELMEEKVAFYIRDIIEALQYLHNCRVAHLDIKVIRNSYPCNEVAQSNLFIITLEGRTF